MKRVVVENYYGRAECLVSGQASEERVFEGFASRHEVGDQMSG